MFIKIQGISGADKICYLDPLKIVGKPNETSDFKSLLVEVSKRLSGIVSEINTYLNSN